MTARSASQKSCQTQLAAQGLSVLTQCLILQLQFSTFVLGLILPFVFPTHSSFCNSIFSFPPLWKQVFGLCFYWSHSTVWWCSALIRTFTAFAIKLLILLHVSSQCCQLSSLLTQKHSGNHLNADNSHPRCSLYLLAFSYKSKQQYFTASRTKNDSWNYRLAASSDNFNPIMLQFIQMKYKTIKRIQKLHLILALFLQVCMSEHWFWKCRNNFLFVGWI